MDTRIVRIRSVQCGFGSSTGSRIAQNRRPPTSEGYAGGRVTLVLQHSLDEAPGDPKTDRDGRRALAPSHARVAYFRT